MVYSQQRETTQTTLTELLRAFEPDDIVELKRASDRDLTVGGPTLAAEAFRHNLVDQVFVLMCPTIVGSGVGFGRSVTAISGCSRRIVSPVGLSISNTMFSTASAT